MGAQIYGRTTVADGDKWVPIKVGADGSLSSGGSGQTVQETANAFGTAPASVAPGSVAGLLAGPLQLAPAAGTVAVLANAVTATGAQTAVDMPKAFVDFNPSY